LEEELEAASLDLLLKVGDAFAEEVIHVWLSVLEGDPGYS
jgi:hypothetical protein